MQQDICLIGRFLDKTGITAYSGGRGVGVPPLFLVITITAARHKYMFGRKVSKRNWRNWLAIPWLFFPPPLPRLFFHQTYNEHAKIALKLHCSETQRIMVVHLDHSNLSGKGESCVHWIHKHLLDNSNLTRVKVASTESTNICWIIPIWQGWKLRPTLNPQTSWF